MNKEELITRIRHEGATNPLAAAVFKLFSLRKRATSSITVTSLMIVMKMEGIIAPRQKYVEFFKFLADCKIGDLLVTNGRVRGLININTTISSLGRVAIGEQASLNNFIQHRKNQYQVLEKTTNGFGNTTLLVRNGVNLTVYINDKPISMDLPKGLSRDELATVIENLSNISK